MEHLLNSKKINTLVEIKTILEEVSKHSNVLITTHKNPDPDAYGSAFGLKGILSTIFPSKDIRVVLEDSPNLSDILNVSSDVIFEDNDLLFIAIDCANTERLAVKPFGNKIVKIDHHPDVEKFEDFTIVDTNSSSACELLCSLFNDEFLLTLDDRTKFFLAFGIIGDTGRFLYNNTTDKTLHYASVLKGNCNWNKEIFLPLYSKPLSRAKMEGHIKNNMKQKGDVLYCVVLKDVRDELGTSIEDTSNCVNEMANIEGFGIWVLVVEDDDYNYRARIRSKEKVINTTAQKYNGGGHPLASGVRFPDYSEIIRLINDLSSL